jgi:hypothetical protein
MSIKYYNVYIKKVNNKRNKFNLKLTFKLDLTFLKKTVGRGHLAKKFLSKNNFLENDAPFFFTSETF